MTTGSPLIDALHPLDRQELLSRALSRKLRRGETLFLAGEHTQRAHVLLQGVLKLASRNRDGQVTILGLALAGDLVGEISALDGLPQPTDAVAATACDVVSLPANVLVDALLRSSSAAFELALGLARRNRWLCDTATERSTSPVSARMAGRLLDLADALGRVERGAVELELPIAQDDLGRLAGTSRESACKTLRSFQRAGMLSYRGRHLRILRPDALERIRCAGRAAPPRAQSSEPAIR